MRRPHRHLLSRLREWTSRLGFLLSRRAQGDQADVDEELQFHLTQSIDRKVAAGLTPKQARREAAIEFGGLEQAREETYRQRPGWFIETLRQDVRYALRGFWRNPAFTVTVLLTLALGIGATTAVFSVVDRILFRALPYEQGDRLVSVGLTAPILPEEFLLGGSYFVWRDNQVPFEAFTSETGVSPCDLTERSPARLSCASVEANFLPTLGVTPLLGRNFLPEEDRPHGPKALLISYGLWRGRFGSDPAILNRLIDIDGIPTRVIGVLPRNFEMPTLEGADVLLPQALDEAAERKADPGRVLYGFARLKPGITAMRAQAALDPLFQYSLKLVPPGFRNEVHLRVRTLRDRQMKDVRLSAWVLLGAGLAVLLIGCGNVAGLMLARGMAREREIAVRSALGASRERLVRQTLTEALLLSLAGASLGWMLAVALVRLFIAIAPAGLPFLGQARLDLRIAAFTAVLAVCCGLFFGALASFERPRSLSGAARPSLSGGGAMLRRTLVTAQIAVGLILLSAASLLVRSFWNLERQDLGLNAHSILTARIVLGQARYGTAQQQMQFFRDAEAALRRLPGVTRVAISDSLPPSGPHRESIFERFVVVGRPQSAAAMDGAGGTGGMVAWRWVTPDYFRTLQIPIEKGRGFTESDRDASQRLMILDRLLAERLFPGQDPIGQRVRPSQQDQEYTVVGVAAKVRNSGLSGSNEPEYYRLRRNVAEDWDSSSVLLVEASGSAGSLSPGLLSPWVLSQIGGIDPIVPVDVETLSKSVNRLADGPRFQAALLGFFALSGLAMAVIGLYGLTTYVAARRTQEIGVRMALGADRMGILRLIAWDGARMILLGTGIGLSAALALTQLLRSLLFGIGPSDPVTFAGTALLLGFVALLATLIPARAAMRVNPAIALRSE